MVKQTSLMAYNELIDEGKIKSQKDRVYFTLINHPEGLTRADIATFAGLMYSSVCARVYSLIEGEEALEDGIAVNRSGKSAYLVRALPSRRLDYLRGIE